MLSQPDKGVLIPGFLLRQVSPSRYLLDCRSDMLKDVYLYKRSVGLVYSAETESASHYSEAKVRKVNVNVTRLAPNPLLFHRNIMVPAESQEKAAPAGKPGKESGRKVNCNTRFENFPNEQIV